MSVTMSKNLFYLKHIFKIALILFVGGVCASVPVCVCVVIRGQLIGGAQGSNSDGPSKQHALLLVKQPRRPIVFIC